MGLRLPTKWECYRREHPQAGWGDATNFMLRIPARGLTIIGSSGGGWEHVSVSHSERCPTWEELEWIKRSVWEDGDTAMQLHVPRSDHVSVHPYCLHLWRPLGVEIPRPPAYMIG